MWSQGLLERCSPLERELMEVKGMNRGPDGIFKAGGMPTREFLSPLRFIYLVAVWQWARPGGCFCAQS
jgi:hypothetical protein